MKKIVFTFLIIFIGFFNVQLLAQCSVTAFAYPTSICIGDAVQLSAAGGCNNIMSNDFNAGVVGAGWQATTGVDFSNPCPPPSDGTTYLWMGDNVPLPRALTTIPFSIQMNGCQVEFDMKYSIQTENSPCEGPDEYNEGVSLQYSINNGATWSDMVYFQPNGVMLLSNPGTTGTCVTSPYITPFTSWAHYSFPIPAAGQTPATLFRWAQLDFTTQDYDHWGLDNVSINCPSDSNTVILWNNGETTFNPPLVYPDHDTTFTITITDTLAGISASDTISIQVFPVPTSTFTLTSPVCSDNFSTITYTGTSSSAATYNWLFSGANILSGTGAGPYNLQWPIGGTMWVSLEVSDSGCTSTATYDTVVVHQAPTASFASDEYQGCQPLTVNFTDLSSPPGSVWQWNFGDMGTSTVQNPSHTYNSAGLFDVSLIVTTAQGCDDTLTNPNYIQVFSQPIANITATPPITSIVDPEISFSSTSSGVADWFWDFGDGATSFDAPVVTHAYLTNDVYNVMLIVSSADGCLDTAYTTVEVIAEPKFYNVITPDGNGLNDVFKIENAETIPGHLQIFNRWGKKIWESSGESYMNDFDGEGFSDGTYYYIYTYGVEMENEYQGTLTILRN